MEQQNQQVHPAFRDALNNCLAASAQVAAQAKQYTPTIIRVGHPAYAGVNAARVCFSKAQAVRVLQARGVERGAARNAIASAVKNHGHTAHNRDGELIECLPLIGEFLDAATLPSFRAYWAQKPEA